MYKSHNFWSPTLCHWVKTGSDLAGRKMWLLQTGPWIEKSVNLKCCLNWDQILRTEITTGHEEYCLGDRGSLAVTSAGSDNDILVFASDWHQSAFCTWIQYTIFLSLLMLMVWHNTPDNKPLTAAEKSHNSLWCFLAPFPITTNHLFVSQTVLAC